MRESSSNTKVGCSVTDKEFTQQFERAPTVISASKAVEIARKFLEQYNSSTVFKFIVLEGDIWMVVMDIGLAFEEIRQVAIDANTGQILGYA